MKRISLICGLIACSATAGFAQDDDALTFTGRALKMSSSEPVLGTARYSGMAGAMGALGGDGSAVKDNPAALGIYRKWDIGITPNVNIDNDANADFNINNFSCIMNFGKSDNSEGYVTSSFGITYNRLANYNRDTYTDGIVAQGGAKGNDYENEFIEDDGSGIWHFAYGMNVSNKVYWGIGLNAATLSYKQTTETRIGSDWEENTFDCQGNGFNLNLGVIIRPADFVRIGASFTSPTWYNITEDAVYPYRDSANNTYYNDWDELEYTGYEDAKYKVQTPLKAEASLGFILGKRAAIDVDYIFQDYSAIRVKDDRGNQFRNDKKFIESNFKSTHTLKVGAEIQIAKGFAARVGYAFQSSPTQDEADGKNIYRQPLYNNGLYVPIKDEDIFYSYSIPKSTQYITFGLGYHGKSFYADLAYVNKQQKEDFYEWQEATLNSANEVTGWAIDPISQTIKTHNIMATIGFKF